MPLMTQKEKDDFYQPIQEVLDRINARLIEVETKLAEISKPQVSPVPKKTTAAKNTKKTEES